jgi:hypothetical protein
MILPIEQNKAISIGTKSNYKENELKSNKEKLEVLKYSP